MSRHLRRPNLDVLDRQIDRYPVTLFGFRIKLVTHCRVIIPHYILTQTAETVTEERNVVCVFSTNYRRGGKKSRLRRQ